MSSVLPPCQTHICHLSQRRCITACSDVTCGVIVGAPAETLQQKQIQTFILHSCIFIRALQLLSNLQHYNGSLQTQSLSIKLV